MPDTVQTAIAPSIFVVDDEPSMRMLARAFLQKGGFNVVDEAEDGPQALERFQDLNPPPVPSVVLLDNRMPGLTGLEVAEQMLTQHPSQVIVLFSAHLDDATRPRHATSASPRASRRRTFLGSRRSSARSCSRTESAER